MKIQSNLRTLAVLLASILTVSAADTVKVFILAGQSNMEGKADQKLIDHQATDAKTKDLFKQLSCRAPQESPAQTSTCLL